MNDEVTFFDEEFVAFEAAAAADALEAAAAAGAFEAAAAAAAAAAFEAAARQNNKFSATELQNGILESFSVVEDRDSFVQFLYERVPPQFEVNLQALNSAFELSRAVIKLKTKVTRPNGTTAVYVGTGTVFDLNDEVVIFTNAHVLTPKETDGETLSGIYAGDLDITDWERRYHATLDVAKIVVPSGHKKRFLAFKFFRPEGIDIDRLSTYLSLFPTLETAGDTGYLFVAIGFPLGLQKRVSAAFMCKRINTFHGVRTHYAPTFGGNSGSILFAIPMGKGDDGRAQAQNVVDNCFGESLESIAGIHYRRTAYNRLNGFIDLVEVFAI